MEAKLLALQNDFTADIKGTLDDSLCSFQELIHTGVCDKLAEFQQQACARIDEKITAVVQKIEYVKGKNARLQKQLALLEAQDLSKVSLIPAITVLQDEVATLQLKLNTASSTEATSMKAETPAS